jgi:hypothetical protein
MQSEMELARSTRRASLPRTFDNRNYAFTEIDVQDKELENLYDFLKKYPHVRKVNFSKNR